MKLDAIGIVSWIATGLVVSVGIYITKEPNMGWAMGLPAIVHVVAIIND